MRFLHGPHPDPLAPWGWSNEPIQLTADVQFQTCRECGHRSDVDEWDCLGADDENAFCPRCWSEQPIAPEIAEVPVSEKAAKLIAELDSAEKPEQGLLFAEPHA